jgi:hypothetical protein
VKRTIALVAAAAVLAALPRLAAEAADPPDFVYDFNGPRGAYEVKRNGTTIPLKPFLVLLARDVVTVKDAANASKTSAKNYIVLNIARRPVTLDADSPAYCVGSPNGDCAKQPPATGTPNAVAVVWTNILSTVGSMLSTAHDDRYSEQTESMVSRGSRGAARLQIPLLSHKGQRVTAGDRALALEWEGGTPPFDVALYRTGSAAPLETRRLDERAVTFPPLSLNAGTYHFEVVDAEKQSAIGEFSVVADGELPKPGADEAQALADPSLSAAVRTTLGAALLAKTDAEWNFEAYQRVAPLAAGCPPAELLRYSLAEGDD